MFIKYWQVYKRSEGIFRIRAVNQVKYLRYRIASNKLRVNLVLLISYQTKGFFLASAAGSSNLIRQMLPIHLKNSQCNYSNMALENWAQGHDSSPPAIGNLKRHGTLRTCRPSVTPFYCLPQYCF